MATASSSAESPVKEDNVLHTESRTMREVTAGSANIDGATCVNSSPDDVNAIGGNRVGVGSFQRAGTGPAATRPIAAKRLHIVERDKKAMEWMSLYITVMYKDREEVRNFLNGVMHRPDREAKNVWGRQCSAVLSG